MQPPPDLQPLFLAIRRLDDECALVKHHTRRLKTWTLISVGMAILNGLCGVANLWSLWRNLHHHT
jgi:hypothetical protein